MGTLCLEILGVAVKDMYVLLRAVDVVEEVVSHERVVALGMLLRQADILVHVESENVLERHTSLLASLSQILIHADRRRACGQAEHKLVIGCGVETVDSLNYMLCSPLRELFVVLFND